MANASKSPEHARWKSGAPADPSPLARARPVLATARPIPPGLPLWRRLLAVRDSSIGLWDAKAFEQELIEQQFGKHRIFVANAPDLVEHVLRDNDSSYVRSPVTRQTLEPALGKGLQTAEGEVWRRQRRIMAPAFVARRVLEFAPAIVRHGDHMLARWDGLGEGAVVDIAEEMNELALSIISEAMFSVVDDPEVAVIGRTVATYLKNIRPTMADMLNLPHWVPRSTKWRARMIFARADRIIHRLVEKRRLERGPDDLLSVMLAAEDDGRVATNEEVRDQVATIYFAGHITTSSALAWAFYLLSLHPDEDERFHAELDEVLGGRLPTAADVPRLTYTRMILDEAVRLYPPVHSMARQTTVDDRLRDTHVPAGSVILVVPWLLHRHRRLWEAPDHFDPERFTPAASAARPRFAYVPFGAGPRTCIGMNFALTEAILLLAVIGQRWRPRLAKDAVVEPVGLIVLRPRFGLPMVLERRR
jgi:cytochrome P450